METFKQLGVSENIINALAEMKISKPTEIQQKAIPYLLKNSTDFIGQAQTGTGKTVAFGVPLLQKIKASDKRIQALVLSPTRELCQQIAKQIFKMTKYSEKIFSEAVYGGEKIEIQIRNLQRPTQILVATPGRLIDLLNREAVDLSNVRMVVLDEADEMLSMGFKEDLDKILNKIHKDCRKWMFSATLPDDLRWLIMKHMSPDTHTIQVSKTEVVNGLIEHQFFICTLNQKFDYLVQFLQSQGAARGIIFCRTKADVEVVTRKLSALKFSVEALHGDLEQRDREKVMRAFKNKKVQMIVATDVAARGIDVEGLAYVAHYQLPDQLEYYTHRSGRTARAGKRGISISFITRDELKMINAIEKKLNIKFLKV
ncbi:DEAD/DEAH box helicase domain protein [Emticicia oligotrophica DSM 17448]|uniref:DEAD/DEAH box helicase domain protein n=1 Tax=Emticicia oligotrophica (strain DSM 17448 / CIP 109782 / MTCC 6937 / GPTSA100-15) TaxID=929562 RepID=A0ABN4AKJ0_EMTOG|nr:DEAD/DEAH box helicase [Emticicia oligotrophica]AFK02400.1 DEAD/DEAH box helicase domain protein [Emticicia oligotrophica DSM 17448]